VRKGSRFCLAVGSVLCAGLVGSAGASAATTVYRSATVGTVARSAPATFAPAPGAPSLRDRGARRPGASSSPTAASVAAPLAPAAQTLGTAASVLTNFNGVSSRDSALTNFGVEFEPPDQGLCVGNGFVVEMVNSAYTVFDTSGKAIAGPFNINGPFNVGLTEFTSDPRCYYDVATKTWFATILQINKEETASSILVAVNNSGDPTKPWTTYQVNTTGLGGSSGPKDPGCPCFGDQPTLGIDRHNLYVTTNEFSITGPQFNGAQVYAFAKKQLASLSETVNLVHFGKLAVGGAPAASVQPALSTGSPPAEYFMSSIDPTETFDQRVGVWALSNQGAVEKGEVPTLSSVVLASEAFGIPPKGEQKGAPSLIDSGDDRMQQTQFINGSVWGELTSAVTIPGDTAARAGAAWFQLKPTLAGGTIAAAKMQRQGYVAVSGNFVSYPSIQVTAAGSAVMGVSITGSSRFPSTAYATLGPSDAAFGPVVVSAAGRGHYAEAATRWGDYSFAVLDPSGSSVWLANEYVPPKASQTADGRRNWGTRVVQVRP
jgi:hypothetical protein